jgi:hypothetical protein
MTTFIRVSGAGPVTGARIALGDALGRRQGDVTSEPKRREAARRLLEEDAGIDALTEPDAAIKQSAHARSTPLPPGP